MSRFERLSGFLASDPSNLSLLADTAVAAYDEGRHAEAAELVDRYAAIAPPPPSLINLLGLIALAEGRAEDAAAIFSALLQDTPEDPGLRFNLAWAKSRTGDPQSALDLLGPDPEAPTAAALVVRSLHHLGRFDDLLAVGDGWEGREGSPDLWGALASAALDAEDMERAARWAPRAPETPDGLSALGMLALSDGREAEARTLFDHALALRPDSARGLIGLGSVLLNDGQAQEAAARFDAAAKVFGDHLGTWIAAGWAWLIAGDLTAARERFERVIALDDTFGEAHGGLAVVDIIEGRGQEASQRTEIALRLDRNGLGGALARSLLLEQAGDAEKSARVLDIALRAPIGPNGMSATEFIARRQARDHQA